MFNIFSTSLRTGRRPGIIIDPTRLPTLQIWYNSDISNTTNFGTAPANAGAVTAWKDRSAFGHDLNQSGNNTVKPKWYSNVQNGLGVLRFDGVDESLNINPVSWLFSLSGYCLFIVAKASALSGTQVLTNTNTGGFKIYHDGTNWAAATSGGAGTSSVAGDTTSFHQFSLIYNGNGADNANRLRFRYDREDKVLNFGATTVGAQTSASAASFYVAENATTTGTEFFKGDIAEIIIFTRLLSNGEIFKVEDYMHNHWNL